MKIKQFDILTFDEWVMCEKTFVGVMGTYKVEIRAVLWSAGKTLYKFACARSNTEVCALFTERFFDKSFVYNGDDESLKSWYEQTVTEFYQFWENYIKSTYLENDAK